MVKTVPHPGEVLASYLKERGMSAASVAMAIGVPANRITELMRGRRNMTPDTAIRLAGYFEGTTPEFWMNLKLQYDLWGARK